jgi:hypothetical protein
VKRVLARRCRAAGQQVQSVVVGRTPRGKVSFREYFSIDAARAPADVIADSSGRWSIEVLFRDLEQMLGFCSSRVRTHEAVLRTTPWVGLNDALLALWCLARGSRGPPSRIASGAREGSPAFRTCFGEHATSSPPLTGVLHVARSATHVVSPIDLAFPPRRPDRDGEQRRKSSQKATPVCRGVGSESGRWASGAPYSSR